MNRVWMDQGGTFTDVVRVDSDGHFTVEKVLTDTATLDVLAQGAGEVRCGTTAATNALLERTGEPVLLITNEGFGELHELGDQRRPDLFRLNIERAPSLATAVLEVGGRISAEGRVLSPLNVDEAKLRGHVTAGIRSAAIVLIHGPAHPATERSIERMCESAGFAQISVGHVVAPSRGYLPRLHTTLADAALTPLLPTAPGLYMRSDGGLSRAGEWSGAHAVLSGPSGGVIATASIAEAAGVGPAFGLDMGGTSTDVCRVDGGPERADHIDISGLRLRVPSLRLETVAAGGGSIVQTLDGVMMVGPRSAGANPGPAAYGRGGPATLTDAEAILGRLPGFPDICGPDRSQRLDLTAARDAIGRAAPGLGIEEAAEGFKTVAAETAARAVRSLAAARGVDPADHALVAFGGAGPGHATAIARALGIQTVLVPHLAGVLSAVGIGQASRRSEVVVPVRDSVGTAVADAIARRPFEGTTRIRLAARHTGTQHTLEIALDTKTAQDHLTEGNIADFHQAHHTQFGFSRPDLEIEPIEIRLSIEEAPDHPTLNFEPPPDTRGVTWAWFGDWMEVPLVPMHSSNGVLGPALLTGSGTTVVVEPGWRVTVGDSWIQLTDEHPKPPIMGTSFHPTHTAVFATRIMAVAEQMGEQLARLARSVSIRQRRDFSAAIFDSDGRLIANAPHVPVHLGAMGETVRDLIEHRKDALTEGTTWASNDPYRGGSHLPDITVIRPVFYGPHRIAFVAVRGHHVDVGGTTPGSMPPHSTHIDEEGLRFHNILLADDHGFHPPPLPGCRQPDEVKADLLAQTAAVAIGAATTVQLIQEIGHAAFKAQMTHLIGQAARSVGRVLLCYGGTHTATEILDDGTKLRVELKVEGDRGSLAIHGSAHPGNLNAPRAVAQAALLYVLRSLVDEPLPLLNEGSLSPVTLETTKGGLFDPQHPAAVAGGNVETSQRLVDALLRALGAQAGSQGTMNNLTVGTRAGVWYETIGGGSGAGPGFDGADAVQVHMTNTRASDVEDLEVRFPVRLTRWGRHADSGGRGKWCGGQGTEKIWEFLDHAEIAILAERRAAGAPGVDGGEPGLPGQDEVDFGQGWEPAPPRFSASAGTRLRIRTPGGGGFGLLPDQD
jgi:5-oxoprolinase (ATP-hydrolysing)